MIEITLQERKKVSVKMVMLQDLITLDDKYFFCSVTSIIGGLNKLRKTL